MITITTSCKSQSKSDEVTLDSFLPDPFEVVLQPKPVLPDSLGGKNVQGTVVVQVFLDTNATIQKYEILLFLLKDRSGKVRIESRLPLRKSKKKYPNAVKKYQPWIENYIQAVVFRRNPLISDVLFKKAMHYVMLPIHIK